ncbi:prephenate dehydrogenase [Priestia taiwanensis]|uniref:Prephenate dehydrogenase n=1 Tax=Priestia taiwanensis TaxID=1347902 RepID=A0A917EMR6_9BACI|nr:prephenate dehydrogenase [Priestia taiwanensis]MBM7361861.1 prephenate dehydrogenase [Priestia taiwanensis]GGE57512.1 prephenate dehydrogenase [Priestia taiwanensis]
MKKRILLIGVGLIGGSIALAIRRKHDVHLVGFDTNKEQEKIANTMNVIDEVAMNLREEVAKADVIIFASPVEHVCTWIEEIASYTFKEGVIVTDVGSTKGKIMTCASKLTERGIAFIGGHPMAGSHKSGVASAKAHLFENAFYLLTPSSSTTAENVETMKQLLDGTGAHFIVMSAEQHDELTGLVSHFPHLIAASLVQQIRSYAQEDELITRLAAGGFRDITRIASSNPEMWRDIMKQNTDNMVLFLKQWIGEMQEVCAMLEEGDGEKVLTYFEEAKVYRDSLPVRKKGAIPSFYDIYVDVVDRPGEIATITALLAKHEVNLINIRILEMREGVMGVLRLSFQEENDCERAKQLLQEHTYDVTTVS